MFSLYLPIIFLWNAVGNDCSDEAHVRCTCVGGDLEICLCFQKDLEIHLYPNKESKDNAKTSLVNTTKLIGFSHCCFFKELESGLPVHIFQSLLLSWNSRKSWVAAGQTRIGTLPTAAHPIQAKEVTQSPVTANKGLTEASPRTSQDIMSGSAG